ncbi:hypothetical protein ACHHYP_05652 [Achlya hypogyna]|uniref:Uncharacterized protein n=1 Tax=Achlya hypogyna TaxID=1202772 RepID=A0A1V9YXL9_ACHHY|nr:hypothetical protein ACHHYP_05652 [Achlya hypogyna]
MAAPPLGLELSYFRRFIELHGGIARFAGLTTAQVCLQFVVPHTASTALSLVEHVRLHSSEASSVRTANWYVSHAWSYIFLDVLESLEAFFPRVGVADPVVWFCVFNNNQHDTVIRPFSWWQSTFKNSLAAIGNVVLVMHPWTSPVTLTRSWCVFEIYVSRCVGARLGVALVPSQQARFFDDLTKDIDLFYDMLASINSEKAQATIPSDKANIDCVIRDEVGFLQLDRTVFATFEGCMLSTAKAALAAATAPRERALSELMLAHLYDERREFEEAKVHAEAALKVLVQEAGFDNLQTITARAHLACTLAETHVHQSRWEPALREAVAMLVNAAGPLSAVTLKYEARLGRLLSSHSLGTSEAITILAAVVYKMQSLYGPRNHRTLIVQSWLDDAIAMESPSSWLPKTTFGASYTSPANSGSPTESPSMMKNE